jgi:hypothetical protein
VPADGFKESGTVLERLGRLPVRAVELQRLKLGSPLAIGQVHEALTVKGEHVEDHVGQGDLLVSVE